MLIPSDSDFSQAVSKLEQAGFSNIPWSYGTVDPKILETNDDPVLHRTYLKRQRDFAKLDAHSTRFHFPPDRGFSVKLVLLRSDYVELDIPQGSTSAGGFDSQDGIFHYPNKLVLLASVIRTLLKEKPSYWKSLLTAWAISFICGHLDVSLDALDGCPNDDVKDWFNKTIRRGQGGLDKSITKRTGRPLP